MAAQNVGTAVKDLAAVACSDVGRRGAMSFLAFASAGGGVTVFNVAYVLLLHIVEYFCICFNVLLCEVRL